MYSYCKDKNIPYQKCGKLIIATKPDELKHLEELYQRGLENNVPNLELLN